MASRKRKQTVVRSPPARTPPVTRTVLVAAGLVALNIFVYWQVRHFQFVNFDDPTYVTKNANVQAGLTWANAWWALTTAHAPYWHPVTWLSHMLDVELFGLDAGAHHVTSVVFHIANTVLLFGWLRRSTGDLWKPAAVAALFAVHPLHVESVAWVTERKDVLSTFFALLAIWAYTSYSDGPRRSRYALVIVFFCLALMSKPMMVTLPVLLLLLDVWPLGRLGPRAPVASVMRLALEKAPLFALAAATAVGTVLIQVQVGAVPGLAALPLGSRLANAVMGFALYLWKTIWPVGLAAFYPIRSWSPTLVAATALGLIAVTVAAIGARERRPYLMVGWLWFIVAVAPVIGLVQAGEQAIADRFMYLPLVGLIFAIVWGMPDLAARWAGVWTRGIAGTAAGAAILACAVVARAQTSHWFDSLALWTHALDVTRGNYLAFENLGQARRDRGDLEGARNAYRQALEVVPADWRQYRAVIHNDIGLVLTREGRPPDALAEYLEAARLDPASADAEVNAGNALATLGRPREALEHFKRALTLNPNLIEAVLGAGGALLGQDDAGGAETYFRRALVIDGASASAHNGLGSALSMEGRIDEALAQYAEAVRLEPGLTSAWFNMGLLLAKQGKLEDARRSLGRALALDPAYQPARQLLATIGGLQ